MNVSAFIRSYRGDFHWLEYCLRALSIRGRQFREIVIAVPVDEAQEAESRFCHFPIRLVAVIEHVPHNPYVSQQVTKSFADKLCESDFVMHFDSDCIALGEINLPDFFVNGRPKLLFRNWQDAGTGIAWQQPTREVLKAEPSFEMMCSHPFIYHRSSHELFRRHLSSIHHCDFIKYVAERHSFSEFNAIGNFCHLYTPDAYHFVRAGGLHDDFPRPFKQFWSKGEFNQAELEKLMP